MIFVLTQACVLFSTIGKLEPSYVIRKFLDAQRIHNLTAYLQALHRQSLPNADHTTLLLNCYTKLKDSSKLEEFIKVCVYILHIPVVAKLRYVCSLILGGTQNKFA